MTPYTPAQIRRAMAARKVNAYMAPAVVDYLTGKSIDGKSHTTWTVACKYNQDERKVQEALHATLNELESSWRK